jgi:hypothetical protein
VATNPIDRDKDAGHAEALENERWRIGPSVSPEARAVLEAALAERPKVSLNEALAAMPDVGLDSDFDRHFKG